MNYFELKKLQQEVRKNELSDKIFKELIDDYIHLTEVGVDEDTLKLLLKDNVYEKQDRGLLPKNIKLEYAINDFFARL